MRNDTLTMAQGALLDGIIPNSIPFVPTPGSLLRTQSAKPVSSLEESDGESEGSNESPKSDDTAIFHKWTLRSMFGFKAASPPPSPRNWVPSPVAEKIRPKVQANFKFSLEYIDRPVFGRDRILGLSRLPSPAQRYLDNIGVEIPTIEVLSGTVTAKHWTYVGRALAEWVLVIVEYESFFDRRKNEGRESDKDVETPSLTVDSMRKF